MISDKQLTRISFLITIIGIIALYFIVQFTEPVKVEIGDISHDMVGNYISLSGYIEDGPQWDKGNLFFILGNGKENIKVIMFAKETKKQQELKELKKADRVHVIGRVDEYKNELEIIASSIEKIS